jgi:hypothetical protein
MRRRAALSVLIALVLVAAACGSSDDSSSSDDADVSADVTADAGVFTSARCVAALQDMAAANVKVGQALTGAAPDLEDLAEGFSDFADAAPSEIEADLKVLADAYAAYVEVAADADITAGSTPSADAMEKLADASEEFSSSEFQAAAQRVQTWFQTKCGK